MPARTFPPSRTARVIKQYIARSEGLDPSQIADIYMDAESDGDAIPDGAKIGIMTDGGPGTTRELPLAIILVDDAQLPEESPAPRTPISPPLPPVQSTGNYFEEISPRLLSTALPPVTPITPPYSLIALPPSNTSVLSGSSGSSSMYRRDSITSSIHHHRESSSRWVIDDDGFGEPIMSPTEADKVKSSRQPPGWLAGRIQTIGKSTYAYQIPFLSPCIANRSLKVKLTMRTFRYCFCCCCGRPPHSRVHGERQEHEYHSVGDCTAEWHACLGGRASYEAAQTQHRRCL